eukprot:4298069-Amphidinium_carterae.1
MLGLTVKSRSFGLSVWPAGVPTLKRCGLLAPRKSISGYVEQPRSGILLFFLKKVLRSVPTKLRRPNYKLGLLGASLGSQGGPPFRTRPRRCPPGVPETLGASLLTVLWAKPEEWIGGV